MIVVKTNIHQNTNINSILYTLLNANSNCIIINNFKGSISNILFSSLLTQYNNIWTINQTITIVYNIKPENIIIYKNLHIKSDLKPRNIVSQII